MPPIRKKIRSASTRVCNQGSSPPNRSNDIERSARQTTCDAELTFMPTNSVASTKRKTTSDVNNSTCAPVDNVELSTCTATAHDAEQVNSLDESSDEELVESNEEYPETNDETSNDDESHSHYVNRKGRRVKKKRKAYVGDLTESDFRSPQAIKKNLTIIKKHIDEQNKKIKVLGQTKRRLEQRLLRLSVLVSRLQGKPEVEETPLEKLDKLLDLPESAAQLVKRSVCKEKTREKYPPELRSFALNLHFYSKKAYSYVRKTFNASLPHPKTLRRWYRVVDGEPGFSVKALSSLKLKVAAQVSKKQDQVYALFVEEVEVRQPTDCGDGKKLTGDVDMDTDSEHEELPVSNLALTFTLDCVNSDWKIPMAYFLLQNLGVTDRAKLVTESLELLHAVGVEPISITFSGTSGNIAAANNIGVNLDLNSLHTYLKHPVTGKGVLVIFDGNHTLSL